MKNLTNFLAFAVLIVLSVSCQQQDLKPNTVLDELSISANLRNYNAHLSAPDGVESQGQGEAIFRFSKDGTELYYKLIVANIENIIMAHIHLRADAQSPNGPPVLWLIPDAPPALSTPITTNGVLVEGTVSAADLVGPLADMTLAMLKNRIREGLTYVNVHTTTYRGGEIRGSIKPNMKN